MKIFLKNTVTILSYYNFIFLHKNSLIKNCKEYEAESGGCLLLQKTYCEADK